MGRRFAVLLVGALSAAMPVIVAPAASAGPQPVDLTCTGTLRASFSPGITLASVNQTVGAELKGGTEFQAGLPCSSVNGIAYQGVTATANLSGKMSCIVGSLAGSGTLKWDNGDISGVSAKATTIGPVPIIEARVTSGALIGSRVVLVGTPTAISGFCVAPVTRLSYVGVASFLKL